MHFESTKIEAETRYNFRNRLEKEQVIANDSDLQDRVAFLGSTVLGLLKDTQAIRTNTSYCRGCRDGINRSSL